MSNVNYLQIGASAECGWYDEVYHYNMQEFAEWYKKLVWLGEIDIQIMGLAFIKLMAKCCVPVDYKYAMGDEGIYVWDFNAETVIVAPTTAGLSIQVIDYAEWCEWYNSAPPITEKTCTTCKHVEVKSGNEPCYSCDSLAGDEFNWEPQEDDD